MDVIKKKNKRPGRPAVRGEESPNTSLFVNREEREKKCPRRRDAPRRKGPRLYAPKREKGSIGFEEKEIGRAGQWRATQARTGQRKRSLFIAPILKGLGETELAPTRKKQPLFKVGGGRYNCFRPARWEGGRWLSTGGEKKKKKRPWGDQKI